MSGHLVYIDDEELLCRSFSWILRSAGIPAKVFSDPDAALAFIRESEIALVLCDFRMPRMNALELLQKIEKELPFYVVSGDLEVARYVEGNARIHGVIEKPFAIEAMLATIRAQLGPVIGQERPGS